MRPLLAIGIGPTPVAPAPGSLQKLNASKSMLQPPPRHAAGSPRGPPASSLGPQGTHRLQLPLQLPQPPQPRHSVAPIEQVDDARHRDVATTTTSVVRIVESYCRTPGRTIKRQATVRPTHRQLSRPAHPATHPKPPTQNRRERIPSGSNTHTLKYILFKPEPLASNV